jgi:hypothetical protein
MATSTIEQLVNTLSVSGDESLKMNGSVENHDLETTINYYDEAKHREEQANEAKEKEKEKEKEANGTEEAEKPKPKVYVNPK